MPNQDMSFVAATGYVVLNLVCSGFPIQFKNLVSVLRGISYLTYTRYSLGIWATQQFEGTKKEFFLSLIDMRQSKHLNFLGLLLIFLGLQLCTYVVLWLHAARVRK